ncbi:MAG: XRE family transcriptional regulator [Pedobacter sp.]|nr:MAG: XRE family transcriptional regulator [Pedobacter sp.]
MSDAKEVIGQLIRDTRKSKGMTQQDLAGKLGVTRHQVAKYESGTKNMTLETIQRLSTELGVSFTITP